MWDVPDRLNVYCTPNLQGSVGFFHCVGFSGTYFQALAGMSDNKKPSLGSA